jgi:glycerophosphoryl diester phosphodiesterase
MHKPLDTEFFDLPLPRLFGHRGASGNYPENTIPAFRAAQAAAVPYIELDVQMTRDGAIVVTHDEDLLRITGQAGRIAEMTLAEVCAADAGFNFSSDGKQFPFRSRGVCVPTLREVLETFPQQFFVIEIKPIAAGLVAALLAVVRDTKMTRRVLIASEHHPPLDQVRALAPRIPTGFSADEVRGFLMSLPSGGTPFTPAGDALQIPPEYQSLKLVTAENVAAAHRLGVEVHVWTVNEAAQMRELLAMGVDGIMTDYPALLVDVVRSL